MPQLFRPGPVFILKLGLGFLVILAVAGIMSCRAIVGETPAVGAAVMQDPPFSHKHHVGDIGIDCRFCHSTVETSAFAGLPPTSTCMNCHSQLFRGQPILNPVFTSFRDDRPLQWIRIHSLPDFVYFNHGIHVAKGVGCSTCHGQIDLMPLTWRTQSLEMRWCLGCHRAPQRYLRPRDQVFNMAWRPAPDQIEQGKRLLVSYQIDVARLSDCSNCHR